jgi:hypothetical protein
LKSKPFACHPLFRDFIRAAKAHHSVNQAQVDAAAEQQANVRKSG